MEHTANLVSPAFGVSCIAALVGAVLYLASSPGARHGVSTEASRASDAFGLDLPTTTLEGTGVSGPTWHFHLNHKKLADVSSGVMVRWGLANGEPRERATGCASKVLTRRGTRKANLTGRLLSGGFLGCYPCDYGS